MAGQEHCGSSCWELQTCTTKLQANPLWHNRTSAATGRSIKGVAVRQKTLAPQQTPPWALCRRNTHHSAHQAVGTFKPPIPETVQTKLAGGPRVDSTLQYSCVACVRHTQQGQEPDRCVVVRGKINSRLAKADARQERTRYLPCWGGTCLLGRHLAFWDTAPYMLG